jgi:hypothetical protein
MQISALGYLGCVRPLKSGVLRLLTAVIVAVLTPFSSVSATATLTLTKGNATLLSSSAIFGGVVHDGSQLIVSYAKGHDLYVRSYDKSFNPLSAEKKITAIGTVTDHKHIFFGSAHYLVYSTLGDSGLYLMKLDKSLVQSGITVTVTQGSTTTKTNDMLLATDGTYIVTGEFRPSNLNNNETTGHLIKRYDTNLNHVSPDITLNKFEHTNTAALLKVGNSMYLVAPSGVVKGGQVQTQLDLLLMRFDTSFNAVDTSSKKIVDSSTIQHSVNGDGIWMSTGLAYDATTDKIIVGHTFRDGASGSDTGKIHLRVFDGTSFAQTYTEIMVDSTKANRAHFLLQSDTLYVVYDDSTSGSPAIYALSYTLKRDTTVASPADCLFNWAEDGYPTFFSPKRPPTQNISGFALRYYTQTNTYLGIFNNNSHLYYYAPAPNSNALLDLGLAAAWQEKAGCVAVALAAPTNVVLAKVDEQTIGTQTIASTTKLKVNWSAPSGYAIDHYEISATETLKNTSVTVTAAASATSATLTPLKAATPYSVVVRACQDSACSSGGTAAAVSGTTPNEYWQLQGTGNSVSGLTKIVSDGNARISATRIGPDAGGSNASRIQLYYGPMMSLGSSQAQLTTATTNSATSASVLSSYINFTRNASTGLVMPATPSTNVKIVATGQGVPLSAAMGGKIRLFFEAEGSDGKTRIFTVDSQDAYVGQDFNSGGATTCSTAADYSTGGGCTPTLAVGVEKDGSAYSRLPNSRQHKVGYPTLTDWRWDGAVGTFMVFTTDSISGCTTYGMNHGYAVWDGSKWNVQYESNGCPKLFKSAQAAFPLHIGGLRYKLYYGDPSISTGRLSGQIPFLGPKKLIYADGLSTGTADRVDFEDWEGQDAARDVIFLWPNGDQLDATAEGYIDDYHYLMPTGSLDLQVMYMAISSGPEAPIGAAAVLLNP